MMRSNDVLGRAPSGTPKAIIDYARVGEVHHHIDEAAEVLAISNLLACEHQDQISSFSALTITPFNAIGIFAFSLLSITIYYTYIELSDEAERYSKLSYYQSNNYTPQFYMLTTFFVSIVLLGLAVFNSCFNPSKIKAACLFDNINSFNKVLIEPTLDKFNILRDSNTLTRDVMNHLFQIEKEIFSRLHDSFRTHPGLLMKLLRDKKSFISQLCEDVINLTIERTLPPSARLFCNRVMQKTSLYNTIMRSIQLDNNVFHSFRQ